jgi:molecular chaperone DnaK (HSP70)
VHIDLTREQFEALSKDLLARVKSAILRVMEKAEKKFENIDCVLLAGGGTRMPMVRNLVRELSGMEPRTTDNMTWGTHTVAIGAAYEARYHLTQDDIKSEYERTIPGTDSSTFETPARPIFDPNRYSDGEYVKAWDEATSHYERLGFNAYETLSNIVVRDACHSRLAWWIQKKEIYEANRMNPIFSMLGIDKTIIMKAIQHLRDANEILSDLQKKAIYDAELKKKSILENEGIFRKAVAAALHDKKITKAKIQAWSVMSSGFGLSEPEALLMIEEEIAKAGAVFVEE